VKDFNTILINIVEMQEEKDLQQLPIAVILLSLAIFFADASHSTVIPVFPGFAEGLGASLSMIGGYGSVSGLIMLLLAIPLGRLSDTYGRRRLMVPGLVLFIFVPLTYMLAYSPLHLFPIRMVLAIAMGSIFSNGFILMSELTTIEQRNTAQGLYMTAMGLGFTLGPLVGGYAAELYGVHYCFFISSGFAVFSLLFLLMVKRDGNIGFHDVREDTNEIGIKDMLKDRKILGSGLANFINSLMFFTVATFFPLYAATIGMNDAQVGIGLTARGLSSTLVRLPVGAIARRIGVLNLMILGLLLSASTIFSVSISEGLILISLIMGLQGIAYGVYLTAGNAYVTESVPSEHRGTAMGIYSTFGNVSRIISPITLGIIGEAWGLKGILQTAAVVSITGSCVIWFLTRYAPSD
jgi:MFS family permease